MDAIDLRALIQRLADAWAALDGDRFLALDGKDWRWQIGNVEDAG